MRKPAEYKSFFPEHMRELVSIMHESGYECYFVGGCVRDFCMNIPAHDFDLTTDADSRTIIDVMQAAGLSATLIGGNCGTVGIKTTDGIAEMTPYRAESGYSDHRHPTKVTFVKNIREDLARRDFTVNAMALTSGNDHEPMIFDPFDGMRDIEKRVIKCVGDPALRFEEDALRILRALRFSARLGFRIEADTADAMRKFGASLSYISGERKRSELYEILCYRHPESVFELFPTVFVEFLGTIFHTQLDNVPNNFEQRLFYLLRDRKSADLADVAEKLKLSKNEAKNIFAYKTIYDSVNGNTEIPDNEFYKLVCDFGMIVADYLRIFGKYKEREYFFNDKHIPKTVSDLDVDGKYIESLGFKGAQIGQILKSILLKCVSGELDNKREKILVYLQNFNH